MNKPRFSDRIYAMRYRQQQGLINDICELMAITFFGFMFAWAVLDAFFPNTPM